jgi:hypothetical protein
MDCLKYAACHCGVRWPSQLQIIDCLQGGLRKVEQITLQDDSQIEALATVTSIIHLFPTDVTRSPANPKREGGDDQLVHSVAGNLSSFTAILTTVSKY